MPPGGLIVHGDGTVASCTEDQEQDGDCGRAGDDISIVAKAIELAFGAVHLNFQLLGNADPHVHVYIVPRYDPDPAPCWPLPAKVWEASRELTNDELHAQVGTLREALANIPA